MRAVAWKSDDFLCEVAVAGRVRPAALRTEPQHAVVNRRYALHHVQGLVGLHAFGRGLPPCAAGLRSGAARHPGSVRRSARSGTPPRRTLAPAALWIQRPGLHERSGLVACGLPLRVCPCTPAPPSTSVCAAAGCVRPSASCSETPPPTGRLAPGHSRSGRPAMNPKSRVRSRRAMQTGRNDWAAPEPVTGNLVLPRSAWAVASAVVRRANRCPMAPFQS
jgi:hypothetical protein